MQRSALFFLCALFCFLAASPVKAQESVRLAPPVLNTPEDMTFLGNGITSLLTTQMDNTGKLAADPKTAAFEIRTSLTAFGGTMVTDLSLADLATQKIVLSRRHSTREEGEILPEITAFGDAVLIFLGGGSTPPPAVSQTPFPSRQTGDAAQKFQVKSISPTYEGAVVSMDRGDLNGDGVMEIVLADRQGIRIRGDKLEKDLAVFSLPHYEQALRVDVLDTNKDGFAEIWLTVLNPETEKLRSRVLVFEKGEIRDSAGTTNRFFAKSRNEEGVPVLLTQMRGFRSKLFSGDIMEARFDGKDMTFHEVPYSGDTLFDGFAVRVRDTETRDKLDIKESGSTSLVSLSGENLWESQKPYGLLPVFMDYAPKDKDHDDPLTRFYFPGRTHVVSETGKPESLLLIDNKDSAGGLFQRVRMFNTGSVHLLTWNGYTLELAGFTPEFDGYIADFIYVPGEKGAAAKIIFASVKGGGNLSLSPRTRFVTCILPKNL